MRRRRKARYYYQDEVQNENLDPGLDEGINIPRKVPQTQVKQEKKDVDLRTVIQCEGNFFCEVVRRLSKEIDCARNLDDLTDIVTLAAKFIQASADKEKALANSLAASKKPGCPEKKCVHEHTKCTPEHTDLDHEPDEEV
ncbi:hypothetical protein NVS47_00480 [Dehalobacterium formicoaceticum]|uniref:Uncharacterized protein n=1 Tax=Dehalobacterium formicoaceticum TaxID=51515 RepID=A0ABT1XZG7_9FIRM|nr:hypothetical protein [Dehalobacterium formicoaceticum]MCR6544008.1 hypothetical protein [Dehalobacterium formicoaceticum]